MRQPTAIDTTVRLIDAFDAATHTVFYPLEKIYIIATDAYRGRVLIEALQAGTESEGWFNAVLFFHENGIGGWVYDRMEETESSGTAHAIFIG